MHARPDFRLSRRSIRAAAKPIGPVRSGDDLLTLRPPRITDGPAWRATSLREEKRLLASFGEPGVAWDETVSLVSWVDRVAQQRTAASAGLLVPYVVASEDGAIAGEISFAIDPLTATAEVSLWLDSATPKQVRTWLIGSSLLRIFNLPEPIDRIVAPVAVDNPGPTPVFERLGFTLQSTARELRPYGDQVVDHDIWWLDRDEALLDRFGRLVASSEAAA